MNHTNLGLLVGPLVHYQMGGYARFLTTLFRPALMTTTLTRSELDVLRELHRGRKPAEIAASLGRAPKTIYSHIHSACSKLELSGADAAVKYAVGQGWLD
jgi:DNA-binding CsgD family transcriptional regulator